MLPGAIAEARAVQAALPEPTRNNTAIVATLGTWSTRFVPTVPLQLVHNLLSIATHASEWTHLCCGRSGTLYIERTSDTYITTQEALWHREVPLYGHIYADIEVRHVAAATTDACLDMTMQDKLVRAARAASDFVVDDAGRVCIDVTDDFDDNFDEWVRIIAASTPKCIS